MINQNNSHCFQELPAIFSLYPQTCGKSDKGAVGILSMLQNREEQTLRSFLPSTKMFCINHETPVSLRNTELCVNQTGTTWPVS